MRTLLTRGFVSLRPDEGETAGCRAGDLSKIKQPVLSCQWPEVKLRDIPVD